MKRAASRSRNDNDAAIDDHLRALIRESRPTGGVPAGPKRAVEAVTGVQLNDVALHRDSKAAEAADRMGARAFTIGRHIYFSRGQFDVGSESGWALLAHELAHAAQSPISAPDFDQPLMLGRPDSAWEGEADAVAERAATLLPTTNSWTQLGATLRSAGEASVPDVRGAATGLASVATIRPTSAMAGLIRRERTGGADKATATHDETHEEESEAASPHEASTKAAEELKATLERLDAMNPKLAPTGSRAGHRFIALMTYSRAFELAEEAALRVTVGPHGTNNKKWLAHPVCDKWRFLGRDARSLADDIYRDLRTDAQNPPVDEEPGLEPYRSPAIKARTRQMRDAGRVWSKRMSALKARYEPLRRQFEAIEASLRRMYYNRALLKEKTTQTPKDAGYTVAWRTLERACLRSVAKEGEEYVSYEALEESHKEAMWLEKWLFARANSREQYRAFSGSMNLTTASVMIGETNSGVVSLRNALRRSMRSSHDGGYRPLKPHMAKLYKRRWLISEEYLKILTGELKKEDSSIYAAVDKPLKYWSVGVHAALQAGGLIPGVGILFDAADAAVYVMEGNFMAAGISVAAMLPALGHGATLARWAKTGGQWALKIGRKVTPAQLKAAIKRGKQWKFRKPPKGHKAPDVPPNKAPDVPPNKAPDAPPNKAPEKAPDKPKTETDAPAGKPKTRPEKGDVLTEKGLSKPVPLTGKEVARVRSWSGARKRFMDRWRGKDYSDLPKESQQLLWGKGDRALKKNMTPDDLAAVMKEKRGVKIPKSGGGHYDHLTEAANAGNALRKQTDRINKRLKALERAGKGSTREARLLGEKVKDLTDVWSRYGQVAGGL